MSLDAKVRLCLGALDLQVELSAEAGQVLAVLGPNGAGKTTLLRVLAGLQPIDSGRIELDGAVLDDPAGRVLVGAECRQVGFLFQDYLLFPHLSVLENVAFGARSRRQGQPQKTAHEWLDRVGLRDLAAAKPAALSGGQTQRVALARALATKPRLLLLDEPLAALDATTKVSVRRELKHHLGSFEGIALLVTHDPVDAAALADSVVILEDGQLTQSGTIAEITARPRSRYVADLVGVNLWRGKANGPSVSVDGIDITAATSSSGDVFVQVHPRSVALYTQQPHGSPRNVWRGRATSIDSTSSGVRVRIEGPLQVVAEITPAAMADLGIVGGEEVWLSFKASEVEVYEA
ncbi:MAG: ABC transporter ATP-binding protein [Chloroflexota bacterium]